jgi:hypothetical protein
LVDRDLEQLVYREKVKTHQNLADRAVGRGDLAEYERQLALMFLYWAALCERVGFWARRGSWRSA